MALPSLVWCADNCNKRQVFEAINYLGYRFFNKGESFLRGLPFSFFMVYVIYKDWLQVGLLASTHNI